MATTLPRPRPDRRALAGLLFAGWSVIVLAAYFSYHPLPMRDGVPVWKGLLTGLGMLVVSWPLWRHADPRRGFQVEHLLLLPILLVAALVMLPLSPAGFGIVLWFFWAFAADIFRRCFGATGLLLALLLWFPGRFAAGSAMQTGVTIFLCILPLPIFMLAFKQRIEPHRYIKRTAVVALTIGILFSLADLQRRYHPVGYLTGIVDETTWLAQNTVPEGIGSRRENLP